MWDGYMEQVRQYNSYEGCEMMGEKAEAVRRRTAGCKTKEGEEASI